jgi:hypothetical protein
MDELVSYVCRLSDEEYNMYFSSSISENIPLLSPAWYIYLIDAIDKRILSTLYVDTILVKFKERFGSSEQNKLKYTASTFQK